VLATSRSPLHLVAEHQLPLAPMVVPAAGSTLATAQESDAVQLFVHRAKMVRPTFELSADNVEDVTAVCRRLDGLPLALELAAARLRLLSPRALLARLDDSLGSAPASSDRPERQRTLHSTLAWSHDLLTPADRVVFRRLAAFVGGAGTDAIEQVAGLGDIDPLDSLGRLIDAGLVRVRERPDGEPHLWMLETVRAYARQQLLASDEADEVLDRHLAWCVDLIEGLAARLHGPAPLMAIDAIDEALPDIRMALGRAMAPDHPERHSTAAQLMEVMSWYWYRYRFADEWRSWNERLRDATGGVDSEALVQSLHGAALGQLQEGSPARAAELLERAIAVARRLGNRALEARELNSLGVTFLDAGDREAAQVHLEASLEIALESGDGAREATALNNLAVLKIEAGAYEEGLAQARRAMQIDSAAGDVWSVILNQINTTPAMMHVDGPQAALAHLRDLIGRVHDAADVDLVADLIDHFVHVEVHAGHPERAARLAGAGDSLREERGIGRHPVEARLLARAETLGREAIGPRWDEEFATGQALDLETALELAGSPVAADSPP
jgi:tetratricopeptide (TPR) repeat protein